MGFSTGLFSVDSPSPSMGEGRVGVKSPRNLVSIKEAGSRLKKELMREWLSIQFFLI